MNSNNKTITKGLLTEFAQANGMSLVDAANYLMNNKDAYSEVNGYAGGGDVNSKYEEEELKKIEQQRAIDKKKYGEAMARQMADQKKAELRTKIYNALDQQRKDKQKFEAEYKKAEIEYNALRKAYDEYSKSSEQNLKRGQTYTDRAIGSSGATNPADVRNNKESILRKMQEKKVVLDKAKINLDSSNDEKRYIDTALGNKPTTTPDKGDRIDYMTGTNYNIKTQEERFPSGEQVDKTTITPAKPAAKGSPKLSNQAKQALATDSVMFDPNKWAAQNAGPDSVPVEQAAGQTQQESLSPYKYGKTINGVDPNQAAYDRDLAARLAETAGQGTGKGGDKFDYSKILGNVVNYGVPALQTFMGYRNLKQAGERPKDQLDADYLAALNKEKANVQKAEQLAKFGYTPEERSFLDMQNQALTNQGRYSARNLTGGSAATALGAERAVLNDAFGRSAMTQIQDRNLQMQKQREAMDRQRTVDAMVADKQDRLRQYFMDDLNAWQQKTSSAAALANAGMQNALDAYRADERLKNFNKQMQQANSFNNPYNTNQ